MEWCSAWRAGSLCPVKCLLRRAGPQVADPVGRGEAAGMRGVPVEQGAVDEAEVPSAGGGVQARGHDVELLGSVEPPGRVVPGCTGLLDLDLEVAAGVGLGRDVL